MANRTTNVPNLEQIFAQMGKTMPLEIGFDRNLAGSKQGVTMTSPVPALYKTSEQVSQLRQTPSLSDIITTSKLPPPSNAPAQYYITSQMGTPAPATAEPEIKIPEAEPEPCAGPSNLCPEEVNQRLFDILTSDPVDISCACNTWDYYPMTNPSEGEFSWKADREFVYRETDTSDYLASDVYKLKYSRWSPLNDSEKPPVRILLLHDALDSRKSWWCCQKLLSPFVDTISVDLLGSGESLKPRGLNESKTGDKADPFPWSFKLHAQYLVGMAKVIWPGEKFYVAGVGWGAQIAASMASITDKMMGFVMINPPGFGKDIHPEIHYADLSNLARILSDQSLEDLDISFVGRVRECLLSSLSSSDIGHSGRDNATTSTLRLILDQYKSLDRKRVLIDQFVMNRNQKHQELPTTEENPLGLEIDKIQASCLVVSGGNDIIYAPEQRHLYPAVYYNTDVSTHFISTVGHLIHIEAPKRLAEIILDFIRLKSGFGSLKNAFIGFLGASQGNEKTVIGELQDLYSL